MIVEPTVETTTDPSVISTENGHSRMPGGSLNHRIHQTLDRVESLGKLLEVDEAYDKPTLDFDIPADFSLSVVIPVYNEQDTIAETIARVRSLPVPTEIIIVDDDSSDGTRHYLQQIAMVEGIRVVLKPRNQGKGAALRTGFAHAQGTVVAIQDADMEYDPRDLLPLIRPILEGSADVVYGSRFANKSNIGSSLM